MCDDGGPGSEYSLCGLGSDCADCGSRCYRSPVPATPYIHSAWPSVTLNTGGRYPGAMFDKRAAVYHGSWTFSFVLRGKDIAQWGSKKVIYDYYDSTSTSASSAGGYRNMDSSVGIGRQLNCGYDETGNSCRPYHREVDRNYCTAQTLFGDDNRWSCRRTAPDGSNCPFVVVEGQGPTNGDMWCRVSPISNDAAHLCKDDPTEFCHVITVRAGPRFGTYLRVDENTADRNVKAVPSPQAGFFGGGTEDPTFETSLMRELVSCLCCSVCYLMCIGTCALWDAVCSRLKL